MKKLKTKFLKLNNMKSPLTKDLLKTNTNENKAIPYDK